MFYPLGAKASPLWRQGLSFSHTKGSRRHKQQAEKGKRNQIKSQRIVRAATHEVPSMRSSLICGRMIHGLFGWESINGEACEASRPCGRIRCRGLLPRGPHASGSYRNLCEHKLGGSPPLAVFVWGKKPGVCRDLSWQEKVAPQGKVAEARPLEAARAGGYIHRVVGDASWRLEKVLESPERTLISART